MGVESVLHEDDLPGLRKVDVRQVLENVGIINGGVTIRGLDVPPPLQRGEHHEHVCRAVAFVFVVESDRFAFFHRYRHALLDNKLLHRNCSPPLSGGDALVHPGRRRAADSPSRGDVVAAGFQRFRQPARACRCAAGALRPECNDRRRLRVGQPKAKNISPARGSS